VCVNQNVHALARHDESNHTDHVIDAYGDRSHSGWNGCRRPSTRAYGRQPVLENRFTFIDESDNTPADHVLLPQYYAWRQWT
jgi:hypothetical protein